MKQDACRYWLGTYQAQKGQHLFILCVQSEILFYTTSLEINLSLSQ